MSLAPSNAWILEDYSDNLDTQDLTNSEGVVTAVRIRDHWTFTRFQKLHALTIVSSQVGQASGSIEYWVGNVRRAKTIVGGNKYICVSDGIAPESLPGDFIVRRQVWEYFSKWRDPPEGWDWAE
jgi:hypothetical protein